MSTEMNWQQEVKHSLMTLDGKIKYLHRDNYIYEHSMSSYRPSSCTYIIIIYYYYFSKVLFASDKIAASGIAMCSDQFWATKIFNFPFPKSLHVSLSQQSWGVWQWHV